jgi:hypothetical protein
MINDHIAGNVRRIALHRATLALLDQGTWLNPRANDVERLLAQIAVLEAVNASAWRTQ